MSLHKHVVFGFEVIITPLHHVTSHHYIQVCICQNKRQHTCPIDLGYSYTMSSYCDTARLWYLLRCSDTMNVRLWDCDSMILWYCCWWKKSCTTWGVRNPVNNGISYLSTGAGFLPSTVGLGHYDALILWYYETILLWYSENWRVWRHDTLRLWSMMLWHYVTMPYYGGCW